MQWFFTKNKLENNILALTKEESHHCVRVLRKNIGDTMVCTDGMGNYYECEIKISDPKHTELLVTKHISEYGKKPYKLHIAIAPTKSNDRMEWFLEKATEIGIDTITPILCEHSERKIIKPERFHRVIESAIKQSQQAYLPILQPMIQFEQFVKLKFESIKCLAYCDEKPAANLKAIIKDHSDILVLIGPEGDFSTNEIQLALQNNFINVNLGNTRLRTETAGVVTTSIVANTLNDFLK